MKAFLPLLKKYKWLFAIVIFLTLVANVLYVYVPKVMGRVIDDAVASGAGLAGASGSITLLLIIACGGLITNFLQVFISGYFSERVALDLRNKLIHKFGSQSFSYISKAGSGKLLTISTADVEAIKGVLTQGLSSVFGALVVLIGSLVLLLTTQLKLGLITIAVIPFLVITIMAVFGKLGIFFKKFQENLEHINNLIHETIVGSALIRVLSSFKAEVHKFDDANIVSKKLGMSIVNIFSALIPIITFLANVAIMIIIWFGGTQVMAGTLSLGDFTAFISYTALFIWPLFTISFIGASLSQGMVSLKRIQDVIDEPVIEESGTYTGEIKGEIVFDSVSLSFTDDEGNEKQILKDISCTIMPGKKTAVVGPTAGGKTQLFYLMTGLVKPTAGTIKIDGRNIDEYNVEALLSQVGLVFQDSLMFNTTFRENIALSSDISPEVLEKALRVAELEDFVKTLPNGLDTSVSERGTSLSGGQKQRIMLARALARDPKILLLDDFTARVDQATETSIIANVTKEFSGITLVSITQKINQIKEYDSVIVIMEGELIAQGNHAELLDKSFEYRQMYDSQQTAHEETKVEQSEIDTGDAGVIEQKNHDQA